MMDEYKPVLTLDDEQYKATMHIRVLDTSKSSLHNEFVEWLKNKKQ